MTDTTATGASAARSIFRISQDPAQADEAGFWSLRALAIERAQAASGAVWTDYNLHDPGLTLLEAVCFALTELVYRARFDVADHLAREDGTIDFDRQALFVPTKIFPSRATTATDLRLALIARDPELCDVRLETDASGEPGLYSLRLQLAKDEVRIPAAHVTRAREAFRAQRGIGEDLDDHVLPIRVDWRWLALDVDLEGAREPEDVVAEIFHICDAFISRTPTVRDRRELRHEGWSLEDILTGPALGRGYMAPSDLTQDEKTLSAGDAPGRPDQFSLSDLRVMVMAIPGVRGMGPPRLEPEPPAGSESANAGVDDTPRTSVTIRGLVVSWNGGEVAPRLRLPEPPGADQAKLRETRRLVERIRLTHRDERVDVDPVEVAARLADLRTAGRQGRAASGDQIGDVEPLPAGTYLPPTPYNTIGNLFPRLYGLAEPGPHGSPDQAQAQDMSQFKAYLALFDQLLANSAAQIHHIRDLFTRCVTTESGAHLPTYWSNILGDECVSGIESLYTPEPALAEPGSEQAASDAAAQRPDIRSSIERCVFARHDDYRTRRHLFLDYLLSLYGDAVDEDGISRFLDYLDEAETGDFLIENKAAYLTELVTLSRDRAAGFDYGAALWSTDEADRTPGLNRRIALLLGFARPSARALSPRLDWVRRAGRVETTRPVVHSDLRSLDWPLDPPQTVLDGSSDRDGHARLDVTAELDLLFQLGVDRRRYRWKPAPDGRRAELFLGPDARGHWVHVATVDEAAKERRADELRRRMLDLTAASEGLHVVEPILLRPRATAGAAGDLGLRATVVFPGWTRRTSRADFRKFAEQTVRMSCPAHVAVSCLWLGLGEMKAFEEDYRRWMTALRGHYHPGGSLEQLDAASAGLLARMLTLAGGVTAQATAP